MQWLQAQTSNAATPEVILHLGAGLCQELDIWRSTGASRIILVEPNPEIFPELRRKAEGTNNIEVLPAAVSDEPGRRALRLYNYPDLSSLRRPTGLIELLPGLKQTGQAIVNVIAAHTLIEQLGLKNDENNWLVIDTPGEEAAIIGNLEQHQQFHYFDHIIIRAGAESLYDGASSAEQLARQLEHLGYYMVGAQDTSDRDWPHYHLRLNPKAIECRRLRRENEALTEQQAQLEKRNQELTEKLEQQESEAQKHSEQQEKQLAEKSEEITVLRTQLNESESKWAAAKAEIKARQNEVLDLEEKIDRLSRENQRKDALIDEEFLKAESQIELIKELVFKDKSA